MSEARHIISNAHAEESIVDVKSPDISAIEVLNEDAASDRDDKNDHELDRDTSTRDLSQYINLINASKLISSPYPDLVNQLTFPDLSLPVRLFAIALSSLTSTRDDYATAPYLDSFNWDFVFALLRTLCILTNTHWQTQDFYVVTFHSKLHRNIDRARLGLLDQKSHEEACASGGLLKYWFGSCDGEMRNLATCEQDLVPADPESPLLTCGQAFGETDKMRQPVGADPGTGRLDLRRAICTKRLSSGRIVWSSKRT